MCKRRLRSVAAKGRSRSAAPLVNFCEFRALVVLTPGDCSTAWFAKCARLASEVRLLNPRVEFVPPPGVKESSPEKGNALFVFRPEAQVAFEPDGDGEIRLWRWKEEVVLNGVG